VRQGFSAEVSGDFGCDDGGGLPRGVLYCHRGPDGTWLPGGASSSGAGALTLLPRRRSRRTHRGLAWITTLARHLIRR
jgi:hypothetical protein